jgi:hypothetical protein
VHACVIVHSFLEWNADLKSCRRALLHVNVTMTYIYVGLSNIAAGCIKFGTSKINYECVIQNEK